MMSSLPVTAGLAMGGLGGMLSMVSTASAQDGGDRAGNGGRGGGGGGLPEKLMKVFSAVHNGDKYTLPPLPYAYDALEPVIDQTTMELHHDKHHQGYVDGLNTAVTMMANEQDPTTMGGLARNLSFNYGGHALHSLFWAVMGPGADGKMGGDPSGPLADAMQNDFGGLDGFKKTWSAVAGTVKGSGWVILAFDPIAVRLHITGVGDHDRFVMPGVFPLMPLDVWEHAYYLNYQNRRGEYVEKFLDIVDWSTVGALYEMVSAPYRQGQA